MIERTFCHIPGVSVRFEQMLWEIGVQCWDCLADRSIVSLSVDRMRRIDDHLRKSREHLLLTDPRFFTGCLPSRYHWRLFSAFRHATAYLDIETTGLGDPGDHITTIALYDGKSVFHYVHGENLEDFKSDIQRYKLLVTYNGKCFDVPFIRRSLGMAMPQAHIDLMYVLRGLGITGGLKGCEKKLGLDRKDLNGVDGFFAVLLWREFVRSGDRAALETLLAYNIEDAVNLETLMVTAYNLNLKDTPFYEELRIPLPGRPEIAFRVDLPTIRRIRERYPGD
jgi:uncharacterized protein YprB with RNaseH-like and TPR domain